MYMNEKDKNMRQDKINRAFRSLSKLRDLSLPVKKARAIYKLYVAIEEAYNFAAEEEKKYLIEFHGTLMPDGSINFKSQEDCEAFKAKFDELCGIETEVEFEPVVLTDDDIGDQPITPGDIFNLEGFVIFE